MILFSHPTGNANVREAARALNEVGLGFFFARAWHPSMRHAGPTRKELGIRTAFNLLGLNPFLTLAIWGATLILTAGLRVTRDRIDVLLHRKRMP